MHVLMGCRQWSKYVSKLRIQDCWRVYEEKRRDEVEVGHWDRGRKAHLRWWPKEGQWQRGEWWRRVGLAGVKGWKEVWWRAGPGEVGTCKVASPGGFSAYSLFLTPCNWKQGILLEVRSDYAIPLFKKINRSEEWMNEWKTLKSFSQPVGWSPNSLSWYES